MRENSVKLKIDSLQAIRAFAAIAVMFFHGTQIIHERIGYLFLNNIFIAGFSGVDIFFVLSGFIILHTSSVSKINSTNFIKKRFIRIYPIYWLVTFLLIISYLISPSTEQAYRGDLGIIFGSLVLYPQKQYVVGVAWSLTYEIVFYLIFALTYFRKPKFLFYALTLWGFIILLAQIFKIKTGIFAIDALIHPLILNFAFGCFIAYIYKHYSIAYSGWFFLIGVVLFILSWSIYYHYKIILPNTTVFNGDMARVYLFGIPAAFLILGATYLKVTVPRVLVYLGDASYSIYLVHGTVLSILIKFVNKFNQSDIFANFSGAIFLFLTTLVICCCFYSLIEKNLLKFINKSLK